MMRDPYKYFRIEARELLDQLNQAVLELEKATTPERVAQLLRLAHTLKGAARVVKRTDIGDLAHAVEDAPRAAARDGSAGDAPADRQRPRLSRRHQRSAGDAHARTAACTITHSTHPSRADRVSVRACSRASGIRRAGSGRAHGARRHRRDGYAAGWLHRSPCPAWRAA
ncbi:MAG: Hpt domain-containing protein [Anaerolineae bacterium]